MTNEIMLSKAGKRIVIATIGSLGDLHPCLALALELTQRGHQVTIAATPYYKPSVEKAGLRFYPIRPNWDPTDRELIRQCEDLKRGPEVLFRKLILPELRETYDDLLSAAAGADLMIAGELVFAAPLVAEKLRLRWVSAILSPCSFFSSHDPSLLVNVPGLIRLRKAGWPVYRAGLALCRMATRHWWNPVRRLRHEVGLREECDPIFRDKFSHDLILALFSRSLAQCQPDWPVQTMQPGFVYFDGQATDAAVSPELTEFLTSGDAPIVFTQGSTAVHNPGNFYEISVETAKRLGRRAVLLGTNAVPGVSSPEILALPYAPYSQIFPHAAVNVHQGGSGTTGQALRSGRPMLIVPYGWDQPDNAARVERLGVGLHVSRNAYSSKTAIAALERLIGDSSFTVRAAEVATQMQREGGLASACNAIEAVWN
jgi:rhamnosyltransferase subunit B